MKRTKRWMSMLLVLVIVLLTACSTNQGTPSASDSAAAPSATESASDAEQSSSADTGEKKTMAFVTYTTGLPYFDRAWIGAQEKAEELGYEISYVGPPTADSAKQITMIQELIEKKVDAMVVTCADSSSIVPVLQKAKEAGIKVVTWDLDTDPEGREYYAGLCDMGDIGIEMVDGMVNAMGDEGEFAIITGVLTAEFLNVRIDKIKAYIEEKYPKLELVAVEAGDSDPQKCYTVAQNLITTYPNLKAIMSNTSDALGSIGQAIEQEGKVGEIIGCGMSTPNLIKKYMESGAVATATLWDPAEWAAFAVAICDQQLKGAEFSIGKVDIPGFDKAELVTDDSLYYYNMIEFTKDNISEYDF